MSRTVFRVTLPRKPSNQDLKYLKQIGLNYFNGKVNGFAEDYDIAATFPEVPVLNKVTSLIQNGKYEYL